MHSLALGDAQQFHATLDFALCLSAAAFSSPQGEAPPEPIPKVARPPGTALAGDLHCRADFDESSHYELGATVNGKGVEGKVAFRYLASDGVDLSSELQPKTAEMEAGKSVALSAASDSMSANLSAPFVAATQDYRGSLEVSFDLDNTSPVMVDAICTLR